MSFVKIIVACVKKLSCDHFFVNKNGVIPVACEIAGVVCDVPLSWLEVISSLIYHGLQRYTKHCENKLLSYFSCSFSNIVKQKKNKAI